MEGIKINRATRDVIERKSYPNLIGSPIPGFEFGGTGPEEWLIVKYDSYPGEYDSLYYEIVKSEDEELDRIEHPDYPGVGQWVIHYRIQKRSNEEILINLENAENIANEMIMPSRKQIKFVMVTLRALIRKVLNNVTPTEIEVKAATYVMKAALKFEQNYITRKNKEALIEQEPDMESDWITEFQEEEPFGEE
jgi:hypothetical protein